MKPTEISSQTRIVLAIEAAIRGGSISLLDGNREAASWQGDSHRSRAEDLLLSIAKLFEQTKIKKTSVNAIAVSNGPGSYTGIRIGLATALGLKNSLEIDCIGVSLLRSIAYTHSELQKSLVAMPIGRAEICWQPFEQIEGSIRAQEPTRSGTTDDFLEAASRHSDVRVVLHHDLYETLRDNPAFDALQSRMIDCGRNLAFAVGIAAQIPGVASDLQPFYVQNSRFSIDNV